MTDIVGSPRPSRWSRWPMLVGAGALLVLSGWAAYGGAWLINLAAGQWGKPDWEFAPYLNVMFGIYAFGLCGLSLGLAVATLRGPVWAGVASTLTGGLIALAVGRWLVGNQVDEAQFGPGWIYLVVGGVLVLCAGAGLGADLVPRIRSRANGQPTAAGGGEGP